MSDSDEPMGGLESLLADLCERGGASNNDLGKIALAVAARREKMRALEAKLEAYVYLTVMREDHSTSLERRVAALEALRDRFALEGIGASAIPQFHDMDTDGTVHPMPNSYPGHGVKWECRHCGYSLMIPGREGSPHVFGACDVLELQKRRQAKATS